MELKYEKIYAPGTDVGLKVTKGHFATNHAHTNYYIDLTTIKSRVSEAQEKMCIRDRHITEDRRP